jgi:uncharacterized protein with NRDE domain
MCLILIAHQVHPAYPLIVAANRDEFFARPTQAARFWPQSPTVLAGQDLTAGGTWMGVTRQGRFAAVTNVREPGTHIPANAKSRGHLVKEYLLSNASPGQYLETLQQDREHYTGFNLICGDWQALHYYSNRSGSAQPIPIGIHGLSNSALNTPWPKVVQGKQALADALQQPDIEMDTILQLLNHRQTADDAQLPDTGVGKPMEKILSSRFIEGQHFDYGTRVSTALRIDRSGKVDFTEQSWDTQGNAAEKRDFHFQLGVQS